MAGAGGIRAGRSFVEVGTDQGPLERGLRQAEARLRAFGRAAEAISAKVGAGFRSIGAGLSSAGDKIAALGAAAGAPLVAASRTFANYEDALAALRATANPTAEELRKIEAAIQDISRATGTGPAEVAASMGELLKASVSLEKAIDGTTEAAVKFAKVAGLDAERAATTLADAMNVFGVDAKTAGDTLAKASDASSVSLEQVTQAFAQVSAVAGQAGLSIEETANAIAILGNAGVKGSDAGTSLKTMLLRLMAPAEEGAKAIAALGIETRQWAGGPLKDMPGLIAELQSKLGGLGDEARDNALRDIFGSDAIRAGAVFLKAGTKGWAEFTARMSQGLSVGAKFSILMDTLSGSFRKALAGLERFGVEVGKALAPALGELASQVQGWLATAAEWAQQNPGLVKGVAALAAGAVGLGVALTALGPIVGAVGTAFVAAAATVGAVTTGFGVLVGVVGLLANPFTAVVAVVAGATAAFTDWSRVASEAAGTVGGAFGSMKDTALKAFGGITDALNAGDVEGALKIVSAALEVEWIKLTRLLGKLWDDFLKGVVDGAKNAAGNLLHGFGGFDAGVAAGLGAGGVKPAQPAAAAPVDPLAEAQRRLDQAIANIQRITPSLLKAATAAAAGGVPPAPTPAAPPGATGRAAEQAVAGGAGAVPKGLGFFGKLLANAAVGGVAGGAGPIADTLDQTERKIEVAGSFSGQQAAAQGFGKTIDDTGKKQVQLLERIARHMDRTGPLVAQEP